MHITTLFLFMAFLSLLIRLKLLRGGDQWTELIKNLLEDAVRGLVEDAIYVNYLNEPKLVYDRLN